MNAKPAINKNTDLFAPDALVQSTESIKARTLKLGASTKNAHYDNAVVFMANSMRHEIDKKIIQDILDDVSYKQRQGRFFDS